MVNHGRPSARTPSWEETELAKQPGMMPYVAPPAVQTAALSIGAPSSSAFYADMNAAFLLPIGAEGFIFSGALSGLRVGGIMATGASFERAVLLNGITSELRTGAMLAGGSMSKTPLLLGRLTVGGVAAQALPAGPLLSPSVINFSQRTVSSNVIQYADDMANGAWDWSRSGPLRVMERDGGWVSYDNRRLLAAQQAGVSVPVQIVQPGELMRPGLT